MSPADFRTYDLMRAVVLAERVHRSQRRDGGEPYIVHPLDVGQRLLEAQAPLHVAVAGILHDIKEDHPKYAPRILMDFGSDVDDLVNEVTNVYTKHAYRGWTSERRHEEEARRLAKCSDFGKAIKLADIGSNSASTDGKRFDFHREYLQRQRRLLETLREAGWGWPGNDYLYKKAWKTVDLAMLRGAA